MSINSKYKNLNTVVINVLCNKNNIIISVTSNGNCILSKSAGTKFRGNQKTTPFASQSIMQDIVSLLKSDTKIESVLLVFRGKNLSILKESTIKPLISENLTIKSIAIDQNLPHGGCRPKKRRRI